jgi:hypothetical protein
VAGSVLSGSSGSFSGSEGTYRERRRRLTQLLAVIGWGAWRWTSRPEPISGSTAHIVKRLDHTVPSFRANGFIRATMIMHKTANTKESMAEFEPVDLCTFGSKYALRVYGLNCMEAGDKT